MPDLNEPFIRKAYYARCPICHIVHEMYLHSYDLMYMREDGILMFSESDNDIFNIICQQCNTNEENRRLNAKAR